jgi:tripartite-type tricarboxylate transporter receptor subunit TctC
MRLLLGLLLAALPFAAQAFPERPPRILVGFAAGGTSDLVSRLVAEGAAPVLGPVVVEVRSGANGYIAAEATARAAPDGHTLYQCAMGPMTILPQLIDVRLPIDPRRDLVPVANVARASWGLVVGANAPHRSLQDLLAAARQRPGEVSFASAGTGTGQHLTGERIAAMAGVRMLHVPYRGAAAALPDLIAGRVDFMVTNLGDIAAQVRGGQLRLLAVGDEAAREFFPEAPTLAETIPNLSITGWFGLCGPRGLPEEVVRRWEEAVRTALGQPAVRQRLRENGLTPAFETAAEFARTMEQDWAAWGEVVRAAGVRAH